MSTNLHLLHMREQITQEARRKLAYAQQRVCQARTLRELALALNVRLGPELHSVGKRLPEWSRLQRQATEQGELLTKAQVAVIPNLHWNRICQGLIGSSIAFGFTNGSIFAGDCRPSLALLSASQGRCDQRLFKR